MADRGASGSVRSRRGRWHRRAGRRGRPPAAKVTDVVQIDHVPVDISDLNLDGISGGTVLADEMTRQFHEGTYSCSICIDTIASAASIFTCPFCYACFHLDCAISWGRSQQGRWRCPNCQSVIESKKKLPRTYTCFCGKTTDPDPGDVPMAVAHSCGEVCSRRNGRCKHPCTLRCHPGPCPDCTAIVSSRCACNRAAFDVRCSAGPQPRPTCFAVCRRLLDCRKHTCKSVCHVGPCQPCSITIKAVCYCGNTVRQVPCSDPIAHIKSSCGQSCNRLLECSQHRCTRICHDGSCTPCDRQISEPQLCACGKSKFPEVHRKSCLDPLPTCGSICNRNLPGCTHTCTSICHDEQPCPTVCSEIVSLPCRCARTLIQRTCHEYQLATHNGGEKQLSCGNLCNALLSCGMHRCSLRCCPLDSLHVCQAGCTKTLACGLHTCDWGCHSGSCPPCARPLLDGISCSCGTTRIPGPVRCGTSIPNCVQPCRSPSRVCAHPCLYTCHPDPCPKCMVLTSRSCAGLHATLPSIPCSAPPVSCGRVCGALIECPRNHRCSRLCHVHEPTSVCAEKCGHLRPCGHPCLQSCHDHESDILTSLPACLIAVEVSCPCGRQTGTKPCGATLFLRCDDTCLIDQRNRAFASALDVQVNRQRRPSPWTVFALKSAVADPDFILRVERRLATFVDSESSSRSLYFDPVAVYARVQTMRQMAAVYGLMSDVIIERDGSRVVRVAKPQSGATIPPLLSVSAANQEQIIPKAANISTGSAALISGIVDVDSFDRLRGHWYRIGSSLNGPPSLILFRWRNQSTLLLVFDSNEALNIALNQIDDAGLVYGSVTRPPAALLDEVVPKADTSSSASASAKSTSVATNRARKKQATSGAPKRSNIWSVLDESDAASSIPDSWDS